MRLAEDEYLIQALAAQCADQTFGTTILPRRPRRDRSIADTHRPHPRREDVSIGAVVVAHQIGWRRGPGECLGDLPSQPLSWYLSTSPVITANWEARSDNRWTVPIGGGLGRIFKIGDQPINARLTAYYNVVTPDDVGASWQLRAQWTFLFPTHLAPGNCPLLA